MLACALSGAWAQDSSTPPTDAPPASGQQPVPAYGQENAPPVVSENPPLSGLDLPSLEPHAAPLSYLQPGATVSETADSNAANLFGSNSHFTSVSRALGSLALRRLWSNYDLALDYVGGVGYYSIKGQGAKLLQQLDLDQKIKWKRGELSLRDSFSYLPEGNFGSSYGSMGSQGVGSLGSAGFGGVFGGSSLGAFGLVPRISNVSIADITESLSPKSSFTALGGYSFTHFYGSDVSGTTFIGTSQISAQAGYNRILTSHTQIALVYGYQALDFSVAGTAFHSHIIQGLYGHRISGRMDLLLGAGPQFTFIDTQAAVCSDPTVPVLLCQVPNTLSSVTDRNTRVGVAAQARLRYKFPRSSLDLSYRRMVTGGSGLFAGAQSDIARLAVDRPLSRVWNAFVDIGYSHNSRVQPLTAEQVLQCTTLISQGQTGTCPSNDATTYSYGFVGGGLHRSFGHNFHGFFSYQFNELSFDRSFCVGSNACNRISSRQAITVGLDWTPRPIRLD